MNFVILNFKLSYRQAFVGLEAFVTSKIGALLSFFSFVKHNLSFLFHLSFFHFSGWSKTWRSERVSISSTILRVFWYVSLFLAAFSSYVLALAKNLYKRFAHITLMKLTEGWKEDHILLPQKWTSWHKATLEVSGKIH